MLYNNWKLLPNFGKSNVSSESVKMEYVGVQRQEYIRIYLRSAKVSLRSSKKAFGFQERRMFFPFHADVAVCPFYLYQLAVSLSASGECADFVLT